MSIKRLLRTFKVQNYWQRQGLIKYIFVFLFLGFAFRIVSVNQLDAGKVSLQEKGVKQTINKLTETARRGDILDRNGEVLASSLILKKVNLDPTKVQLEYIPKLATALNMSNKKLSKILAKKRKIGSRYLIIKKNLMLTDPIISNIVKLQKEKIKDRTKVCRIKKKKDKVELLDRALSFLKVKEIKITYSNIKSCQKEKIDGLVLQEDTYRSYPKGASLAPLLGRTHRDSGIETEFNHVLAGQDGKKQLKYNQNSRGSYFIPEIISTLKHGQDIKLTIDSKIQYHAYTALEKSVKKHAADSGSAIILAANGEVLAMANYPADDPNDRSVYNAENYRNRVLSDKVEPGSTMKPFTMLLALDQNKITATADELIDVSKSIGHIKSDAKAKKYGKAITVKKILEKSHNLGTVNVSERLDKEDMYSTWNKLGFGHPLGLIPGIENSGILKHFASWGSADKRTLSFGYGPMNTNLAQLARAYLVFANKGSIPPLKLLKEANTIEDTVQVFNPKSIDKIAQLLDSVASNNGSGYWSDIKGYHVAGKTGTAEMKIKGGKGYNKNGANRTFFTGFVPVKNPKYIMAIRLDYPKKCHARNHPNKKRDCQGSNSAAIVFQEAMTNILSSDQSIKLMAGK